MVPLNRTGSFDEKIIHHKVVTKAIKKEKVCLRDSNITRISSHFVNSCITWGMMDSLLLRSFSPSSRMSISSMLIVPVGSAKRNKVESKDDLPAPVRPTTPIYNQKLKRVQLYTLLFKS